MSARGHNQQPTQRPKRTRRFQENGYSITYLAGNSDLLRALGHLDGFEGVLAVARISSNWSTRLKNGGQAILRNVHLIFLGVRDRGAGAPAGQSGARAGSGRTVFPNC